MSTSKAKTGGRTAGAPNKRTLDAIEAFGEFCPLQEIVEKLKKPGIRDDLYLQTCIKLLEYKFPKRKAIETFPDLNEASKESLLAEIREIYEKETGEKL